MHEVLLAFLEVRFWGLLLLDIYMFMDALPALVA